MRVWLANVLLGVRVPLLRLARLPAHVEVNHSSCGLRHPSTEINLQGLKHINPAVWQAVVPAF